MTSTDALPAHSRDPRLAPLALAAAPAWLWTADATRVVWANAAGSGLLGAASPTRLSERRFDRNHAAAGDLTRLVGGLRSDGTAQLARLRGLAPGVGRLLLASCSRLRLADGTACILVVAAEPTKPALPLRERVRRMLVDAPDGVAFAADGSLLHAGDAARTRLSGRDTLDALGAGALAAQALASGTAAGATAAGAIRLDRIGAGDAVALLASWEAAEPAPAHSPPATSGPQAAVEPVAEAVTTAIVDVVARHEDVSLPACDAASPPAEIAETVAAAETAASSETVAEPEVVAPAETIAPSRPEHADAAAEVPAAPAAMARDEALAALDEAAARLVARHHPLRFVWTIDADGRFAIERGEFTALAGEPTAAVQDRPWEEVAGALGLDPDGRVARAVASHDTWSGVTVAWPMQDTTHRLPVLMSGLPTLGRDRSFRGYRGFGVCREIDRIAAVIAARRARLLSDEPEQTGAPAGDGKPPARETAAPDQLADENNAPVAPSGSSPSEERSAEAAPAEAARPQLTVVPPAKNVVPFRGGAPAERRATLSTVERNAFQEIARALGARLETDTEAAAAPIALPDDAQDATRVDPIAAEPQAPPLQAAETNTEQASAEAAADSAATASFLNGRPARQPAHPAPGPLLERLVLDRLSVAVIVYRADKVLLANRALLEWTGFENLDALTAAGGLEALFDDPVTLVPEPDGVVHTIVLRSAAQPIPVNARLSAIGLDDGTALMLTLMRIVPDAQQDQARLALDAAEATVGELRSILDTATDGVILVDEDGLVLTANRSAEALFGYESHELARRSFVDLFAPESQRTAADYLEGLTRSGVASLLNDGREVIGRVRQGGLIPLFMTMGRIADAPAKFCMVFRDITQWKRAEEELTNAKRQAEKASSAKSDFLAKISHEIRTPLNAIIGFSEVMMEQRFGPIGNERYRDYLRDIHTSGEHMISLLNDLLDLSKIEAGKLELTFAKVDLNDVMQQCVAIMQPQANRERIIIRTALSSTLPPVVADARSVRQIVLNLLSNSIKFTGAGGQVIVSTALTDGGEAVMRVRDTGVGMSEKDIATALEPFRQLPTSARPGTVGTGLGLPLSKALAEANRAAFRINSAVNSGTLVEIVFPPTRVLAE